MKTSNGLISAGLLLAVLVSARGQTTFTKITTGAIVNDPGQIAYCAWGDFNNDGFLDLVVANWGGRTNFVYLNNGNGTFTRVASGDPVQDSDYHIGAAFGDYDNDGSLDLVVSAGDSAPNARRTRLYHGIGGGAFSPVSGGVVTNQTGFFGPCLWVDYDNDGLLDLFVAEHGSSGSGGKNLLFYNNGDGTFTKVTAGAVVNDTAVAFSAMWADYDNDGFSDLLVANIEANFQNGANPVIFLYHNNRDGTFTRILTNAIATDQWPTGADGCAWGDYDNDGFLDVFITGSDGTPNRLYRNVGGTTFAAIPSTPMASRPSGTASVACGWGDYDNDGWLDLVVTGGGGQNRIFHNNGDGTFTEFLSTLPDDGGPNIYCEGCSWVDYDNDGFLDLFITRLPNDGTLISNLLYHNDGNTNAWLEVKLVGTASNRSAIGAKVRAHATIGGKSFWQLREISNGSGKWAQPLVAHFGLGDATNVDLVRIEWPSGIVQTLTNVSPKQILTVVEHQAGIVNHPRFSSVSRAANAEVELFVTGDTGRLYLFEASTNLQNWTWLGVRSNATGIVSFTDTRATNYHSRYYRVLVP